MKRIVYNWQHFLEITRKYGEDHRKVPTKWPSSKEGAVYDRRLVLPESVKEATKKAPPKSEDRRDVLH
jgi:hypothetical protein